MPFDYRALARFLRYTCVGGGTFTLDLSMLCLFTEIFDLPTVFSAGLAFLIAVSLNYFISRKIVFKGTSREIKQGYIGFLIIAGTGLVIVSGGMYLMVDRFRWQYLISRILVSLITGVWNYLLNLHINFKVAGKPFT